MDLAIELGLPLVQLDALVGLGSHHTTRGELAEAHLLLGVSHFEVSSETEAEVEFRNALRYDIDLALDPLLFSEKAVAFFEATKAAYREKAVEDAEMRRLVLESLGLTH